MRREYQTWITSDGDFVKVMDMTDEHLGNAIRYLEQCRNELGDAEGAGYSMLGLFRGEMAIADVESNLSVLEGDMVEVDDDLSMLREEHKYRKTVGIMIK